MSNFFFIYFNGKSFSPNCIKLFICFAVIACSCLSLLTYSRNMVWFDTVSLYNDCIYKAPNKARTHSNLATAWIKKGEYNKALLEAEMAIALGVKGYEEYWVAACDIISSLSLMEIDEFVLQSENHTKSKRAAYGAQFQQPPPRWRG